MSRQRHIACLTFDFDAMSGLVARGLTTPTPVSRGEFGAVAVPRILSLLARYDAKASFFIPGVVIGTYPQVCEQIVRAGHEIGHHGWTHVPPSSLTLEQEEEGLARGTESIVRLTGKPPVGYRSPSWDLGPNTLALLLKHGFLYESSMMGNDHEPYRVRQGDVVSLDAPMVFGRPTPLIEMPISWSLDDFPHFEFLRVGQSVTPGLMNASGVLENWLGDFQYMARTCDWGVLTYTCHPYVIGRGHRMLMLERLIEGLLAQGAQFLTLEQAAAEYARRAPMPG
ncbi:polysaccharide deacetylase [Orrella sp. JC864]|uniref:polysaccharide deacetylase family protein n=1 Tax=Orrella sp. JC864 TaxID=3120298 RepID=UPI0012BD5FBA